MKGIILTNAYYKTPSTVYQAERMKEEVEKLGLRCDILENNGGFCHIKDGKLCALDVDFCIYFDKDLYVLQALEGNGIRVFNQYESVKLCDDKMLTHLALIGVADMPDTMSGTYSYSPVEEREENLKKIEERFSYPMVLKLNSSSLGAGVYLVNNRSELKEKISTLSGKGYLIQEYIRESSGEDIRVILVGGKVVTAMKRHSESDFRSNIELGGVGEKVELDADTITFAQRIAQKLNLDYCGVDILKKDGKNLLCEVNSNAFFGGIEKITGVNVAEIYAKHVVGVMRGIYEK